jgi:hypothetical protein
MESDRATTALPGLVIREYQRRVQLGVDVGVDRERRDGDGDHAG